MEGYEHTESVRVSGTIDMSASSPYSHSSDQESDSDTSGNSDLDNLYQSFDCEDKLL